MSKMRMTITFAGLVEYIAEADFDEIFKIANKYIRDNFDLSQEALADLVGLIKQIQLDVSVRNTEY